MDGILIVKVSGELDLSVWDEFGPRLHELAGSTDATKVLLDLSGVGFIDAHCAGLIMEAEAEARARGRVLRVAGLRGCVPALVFKVLGLDYLLARPTFAERRWR